MNKLEELFEKTQQAMSRVRALSRNAPLTDADFEVFWFCTEADTKEARSNLTKLFDGKGTVAYGSFTTSKIPSHSESIYYRGVTIELINIGGAHSRASVYPNIRKIIAHIQVAEAAPAPCNTTPCSTA